MNILGTDQKRAPSLFWQGGGGVYITVGTVTLDSCNVYSNNAGVSARHLDSPWKFLHRLDGVLTFIDVNLRFRFA